MQVQCVNLLRYALPRDAVLHHSHNEGKRSITDAKMAKAMGQCAGFSDLLILWRSVAYFIELKWGKNAQTPNQVQFEADLRATGFDHYAVCWSWDDVEAALRGWGIPLRIIGNSKPIGVLGA